MGILYEKILALCDAKGIKGGKMCTDIGISKGLLTDLKMGRRSGVSAVTAQKIASYFGVSVGYLLGEENENTPSQPKSAEGIDLSNITETQRMIIEAVLTMPVDRQNALAQILGLEV